MVWTLRNGSNARMRTILGLELTAHAEMQMETRDISEDMVSMVLTDFDCFRRNGCDRHNYVNLWRGPVRVTLAIEPTRFVIVTVAWTSFYQQTKAIAV